MLLNYYKILTCKKNCKIIYFCCQNQHPSPYTPPQFVFGYDLTLKIANNYRKKQSMPNWITTTTIKSTNRQTVWVSHSFQSITSFHLRLFLLGTLYYFFIYQRFRRRMIWFALWDVKFLTNLCCEWVTFSLRGLFNFLFLPVLFTVLFRFILRVFCTKTSLSLII